MIIYLTIFYSHRMLPYRTIKPSGSAQSTVIPEIFNVVENYISINIVAAGGTIKPP